MTALKLWSDKKQSVVFTLDGCDQHYTAHITLGICQDLFTNDPINGINSLAGQKKIIKCRLG